MKKLYLILFCFLFLSSCNTPNYKPRDYPSALIINADLQIEVKLTYGTPKGCKVNLTILNKTSKNFDSVYVEVSVYDFSGNNIDMVNFINAIGKFETLKRDRTFFKYECYDIGDIKITKTSYR
jgi:hypothetical protein